MSASAYAQAAVERIGDFPVTENTTIHVDEGEVKRIDYLSGTKQAIVTKTGKGTLEVGLWGNTNVILVVEAGTFKPVKPEFRFTASTDIAYRFDAAATDSMTIETVNGTNFVSRWNDADGRNQSLTPYSQYYPNPYLVANGLNGKPVMDFGTLYSSGFTGDKGYGAAMKFSAKAWPNEVYYIWCDDPTAKTREHSSASFVGSTVLNASGFYRGLGGNGEGFKMFYTAPSRISSNYFVDDYNPKSAAYVPDDGWHLMRWKTSPAFDTETHRADYGPNVTGHHTLSGVTTTGGFKLAELIVCSNQLSEAESEYVNNYLKAKWLRPAVALQVNVADGATIDASEYPLWTQTLQYTGSARLIGENNLHVGVYLALSNELYECTGTYEARDRAQGATPNLGFAGEGNISVAEGCARGNIVAAQGGKVNKLGAGELQVGYFDESVTRLQVADGTLTYSPLLTAATAVHLDPSRADLRTTVTVDDKELVHRMQDVNDPYQAIVRTTRGYKHATGKTINEPYVALGEANGLDLLDFGTLASGSHPGGWGAGMDFARHYAGNATNIAPRQFILVWQDRDDAIDLPPIESEGQLHEITGPCLFGDAWAWWRGCGGNGQGFQMQCWSSPATFREDVIIDNVRVWAPGMRTYRPTKGLHLMDIRPSSPNGYQLDTIGMSEGINTTNNFSTTYGVWGGLKFGEIMMFRHHVPERQRALIANAMGVKWFGEGNAHGFRLAHEFDGLEVAGGACARFPYAEVTVTNLVASGEIEASSLILPTGGCLKLAGDASSTPCLKAGKVVFGDNGVIDFSSLAGINRSHEVKVIAASEVEGDWSRWKGRSPDGVITARLVKRDDGIYATLTAHGFFISFR